MELADIAPDYISHYTTISGMMQIISNRCLWASNASFLNDRSELLHALDAAKTAIEKLTSTKAMKQWRPHLERVVNELTDGKIPDTFVTCFCQDSDNLSQWRGYGGREQGISITFDVEQLSQRLAAEKAKLYKVTYAKLSTPSKVRDTLKGELSELADLNDILGSTPEEDYRDVFRIVSSLLPKFKHLGFKDEREWRFVVQRPTRASRLKFRAGRNRIIPYMELGKADDPLPISMIRVGPGDDQELTAQSLRPFLKANGYEDVEITVSDVPFRS